MRGTKLKVQTLVKEKLVMHFVFWADVVFGLATPLNQTLCLNDTHSLYIFDQ